jgi:hypothetical protein
MGEVMIRLAELAKQYRDDFLDTYSSKITNEHRYALKSLIQCRTPACGEMRYDCQPCDQHQSFYHSCGHRSCPQCQHSTNSQWLVKQQQKLLPVHYSMVTFTLPYQLRSLAWKHQKIIYPIFFKAVTETLNTFAKNDRQLQGSLGMTTVLHTHSRQLEYHPHIHVLIPAGSVNRTRTCWREKSSRYLFNGRALGVVFRAKFIAYLKMTGLVLPKDLPSKWVAQCQSVGKGEPALKYLARYLYRGILNEKNILKHQDGIVTFRYKDSKTKQWKRREETAIKFLWLVLQHVLPKGLRRVRDYGYLHGNAKSLLQKIQLQLKVNLESLEHSTKKEHCCPKCHAVMLLTPFFRKRASLKFQSG